MTEEPAGSVIGANLDKLEHLGRIVNMVGVPLLLVFFIAVNIGWIDSPLARSIRENTELNHQILDGLETHHRKTLEMEATRTRELQEAAIIIKRLTDLIKMIDCSAIQDPRLRERCLTR
jgi:hypothetical protein